MINNLYNTKGHNIVSESLLRINDVEEGELFSLENNTTIRLSLNNSNSIHYFLLDRKDIKPGEILFISPQGFARTIFSPTSSDNVIFITGQCNNRCMMCSQPPILTNDLDHYYRLNTRLLELMPPTTSNLGITGGEPTLLGLRLVELIKLVYIKNGDISIHLLSNGRAYAEKNYTATFAEFSTKDLMIGVPLHSDYEGDHDKMACVQGAYSQALAGLYNLALYNIDIEIRIVINLINYRRLPQISRFIFRNLPFVRHVAFMGLEYTGLSLKNKSQIWIDPVEYANQLEEAVIELSSWGIQTSVYNLPHCLLKPSIYTFSKHSISDWKESYLEQCNMCKLKRECGGLFSTSKIQSSNIKPII